MKITKNLDPLFPYSFKVDEEYWHLFISYLEFVLGHRNSYKIEKRKLSHFFRFRYYGFPLTEEEYTVAKEFIEIYGKH